MRYNKKFGKIHKFLQYKELVKKVELIDPGAASILNKPNTFPKCANFCYSDSLYGCFYWGYSEDEGTSNELFEFWENIHSQIDIIKTGYLKKDTKERYNSKRGWFVNAWRIVDIDGKDMIQPWSNTRAEAIETARLAKIYLIF